MTNLKKYFPLLKTRKDVLSEIQADSRFSQTFDRWKKEEQERFLDICTGNRGLKILYDVYFQEIFNPDANPERLADLLSVILEKQVETVTYLRRESSIIEDDWNLLTLDIVVKLQDGSIVNVEMQKIGYKFPGERACCYSSDLVLRQYGTVKREKSKDFTYRDMKPVYSIIFIEKSTEVFHKMPDKYIHRFEQASDTGLELELLQHYIFVPLDEFRETMKGIEKLTKLEAWLLFLSSDAPEDICRVIEEYPEFMQIYEEIFSICQNVERMMEMYSKELAAIDKNTVKLMIDELQEEANKANARAEKEAQRADEADAKAEKESQRADVADAEAEKANARAEKAIAENKTLQKQNEEKNAREIREMYKNGIELSLIADIKGMDVQAVNTILGI